MSLKPSIGQIVNPFFLQDGQDANPSAVNYPLNVADGVKGGSSAVDPLSLDIIGLPAGTLATTTELAINNGAVNEKTTLSDLATFLDGRDVYSVADITALNAITGMDTGDVAIVADTFDDTGENIAGSYVYNGTTWILQSWYNVYLNTLLDVNAPSPVAGDILQWDGTQWVNNSSGGVTSLNTLTGALNLVAGNNIDVTASGTDITIDANFTQMGKYMISGGATWSGTGLTYDVSFLTYFFSGNKTANPTSVTLDPSDPTNSRLDAIVVDEAGVVSVITGTPSSSPVEPPIPADQLQVQFILVEAGSTAPTIATENIYLDDPTSGWTFSTYSTATPTTGSINFAGTNTPKQGINDIEASTDLRLGARFVRGTSFDAFQYTMFQVWVRFTGTAVASNKSLNVRFENSAGTLVGNTINLFNYGLQRNVLNTWQLVVVPITAFGALPATVKGLKVIMAGGTVGQARQWDIDYMILTNGSVPFANVPTIVFAKDGTNIASQSGLNLIEGTGVTIDAVNNPLYNRVDYTINSSGGGSPAGSDTQIQYNNAGSFGASSDFTFDPANSDFVSTTNNSKLLNADNIFFGVLPFTGSYAEYTDTNDYINFSGIAGQSDMANSKSTFLGLLDNTNGYQGIIITSANKTLGHITTNISNYDSNSYGTELVLTTNTANSSLFSKNTATSSDQFELGIDSLQMNHINNVTGDTSSLQIADGTLNVKLPHTQQSAVSFTGSGLDDLIFLQNSFTGTLPTTYTVTIDGINKDVLLIQTSTITGGSFAISDNITNGLGASATIDAISTLPSDDKTVLVLSSVSGSFNSGNTIDNGSGVTGTSASGVQTYDTITWTDGTTTVNNTIGVDSNGIITGFSSPTGHTLTDSWTWTYSNVQNDILDFSNGTYKFGTDFGTDYFGYEVGNNIFGVGFKGSLNTYSNTAGDIGLSGINNTQQLQIIDQLSFSDSNSTTQSLLKNQYDVEVSNGTELSSIGMTATTFQLKSNLSSGEHGISQSAGTISLGNLSGGNNTNITINDVNERITINNVKSFDDDAAAGVGGLTAGMVYMTTGSGSAPLNAAGILMIKQ